MCRRSEHHHYTDRRWRVIIIMASALYTVFITLLCFFCESHYYGKRKEISKIRSSIYVIYKNGFQSKLFTMKHP